MAPEAEEGNLRRDTAEVEGSREEEEEASVEDREGEAEDDDEGVEGPSHLPLAPTGEQFDSSTTVDPSHIISLIRKLLPEDKTKGNGVGCELDEKQKTNRLIDGSEKVMSAAIGDPWEEYGCILWDLSVGKDHAKLMVDNLLLEVLLANLTVSSSSRVKEICLGIFGNLACHDILATTIISTKGLVETVVSQLFLEDTACLSETCRLLTVGLQSSVFASWAEALQAEDVLARILWIAENTLNLQLLEKSIGLLLAIVDNQEVASLLLPSLNNLGLPSVLISLLVSEISTLMDENKLERISVLDLILRSVESLSTVDSCSQVISSNEELFQVLCNIVKLHDKIEVGILCPTVVVIIANILTDETCLGSRLSQDVHFLRGLLDFFSFVATDLQARNALWSILSRSLTQIQVKDMSSSDIQQHASVLLDKACLIEEDLDGRSDQGFEEPNSNAVMEEKLNIIPALRSIANILDQWIAEKPPGSNNSEEDADADGVSLARRLLHCCARYIT